MDAATVGSLCEFVKKCSSACRLSANCMDGKWKITEDGKHLKNFKSN